MMARMPELSSRLTSPTEKPSRLSISSWDRTRSPPFLPPEKSRPPSSTIAAHCSAIAPDSSFWAAGAAAGIGSSESSEASHWAAIASWSTWSLPAIASPALSSLNDDFLEQHGADLARGNRDIDAPRQLFLQAEQSGGAVEIRGPQFAHVGLKNVADPRHGRLDGVDLLLFLELEHDLHFQVLGALAGRADEVDQHLGHIEEDRRLCRRLGTQLLAMAAEKEEPAGAAATREQQDGSRDHDQLLLAFLRRGGLLRGALFRLIALCHAGPSGLEQAQCGRSRRMRYKCPRRARALN